MKFKERLIDSNSTNYRDIPHLFIQNVKVKNFDDRDNHAMSGPKYSIKAHDTVVGAQSHTQTKKKFFKQVPLDQPNKTGQLLTLLNLAVGKKERHIS